MFIALTAFPLLFSVPGLRKTGALVEYGPFWITIRANEAWLMFGVYFIAVYAVIIYLYLRWKR